VGEGVQTRYPCRGIKTTVCWESKPPLALGDQKGRRPFGQGLGTAGPHVYPYSPPLWGGVGGGGGGGGANKIPLPGDQNDRLVAITQVAGGYECGNVRAAGTRWVEPRTYVINGINNSNGKNPPKAIQDFAKSVNTELGREEVKLVPGIYNHGLVLDLADVAMEMAHLARGSAEVIEYVRMDLANNPLKSGEKLNLIGYSGGGQVALNVAQNLEGSYKVDHVVTLGSPIMPLVKSNITRTTHIVSEKDDLIHSKLFSIWDQSTRKDKGSQKIEYQKELNIEHSGSNSYLYKPIVMRKVAELIK